MSTNIPHTSETEDGRRKPAVPFAYYSPGCGISTIRGICCVSVLLIMNENENRLVKGGFPWRLHQAVMNFTKHIMKHVIPEPNFSSIIVRDYEFWNYSGFVQWCNLKFSMPYSVVWVSEWVSEWVSVCVCVCVCARARVCRLYSIRCGGEENASYPLCNWIIQSYKNIRISSYYSYRTNKSENRRLICGTERKWF
jgi:hypothetical protein